ncbi:hypothetical protein F7725_001582 [Dissostichus mawsoni]|uniref:Uncharacterized protein n=1 Tax=Dissostichus mawsoni TaxID=36200 RepID=A0A7J5Y0Z5_DISMA|nr:hypothetical protein F7725_001582 [Dissostichus mawsoni]
MIRKKYLTCRQLIEKECAKKRIQSKSSQVILLNCMRSESSEQTKQTEETVFIGNDLSEKEQELNREDTQECRHVLWVHDLEEELQARVCSRSGPQYLKSFNINQKHAQLLAVLVLLKVYCNRSSLSVSLCEEFLGLQPKPVCGTIKVEEGFGKFSTLIDTCSVAVRKLYESTQGKDQLLQDVHHILVKRYHSVEESQFSPLIQHIASETPGLEEMVLQNASKRFPKDAVVSQLLARQQIGHVSKGTLQESSYFADTSAQVIKHELKNAIANYKEEPISPKIGRVSQNGPVSNRCVQGYTEHCKEGVIASIEKLERQLPFNTAGCLGEIQVGVIVIEVLAKTPVFSYDNVRHDIMSGFSLEM